MEFSYTKIILFLCMTMSYPPPYKLQKYQNSNASIHNFRKKAYRTIAPRFNIKILLLCEGRSKTKLYHTVFIQTQPYKYRRQNKDPTYKQNVYYGYPIATPYKCPKLSGSRSVSYV